MKKATTKWPPIKKSILQNVSEISDLHPSNGSPPDRGRELNTIKLEILKIEELIRLQSSKRKDAEVRTVPPDFGLGKSTRRRGTLPRRGKMKELKLCGENEMIRKTEESNEQNVHEWKIAERHSTTRPCYSPTVISGLQAD